MTLEHIAADLIALRISGQTVEAIERYFADDVVCLDVSDPMTVTRTKSEAIAEWRRWRAAHDVHGCAARGPWLNGNRVVFELMHDVSCVTTRARWTEHETAICTMHDGLVRQIQCFTHL
jgi:hypothetical protein